MGRMPHDRSRDAYPHRRVDADLLTVDDDLPAPRTHLGEPLRVQRDSGARAQDVPLLLHDVEQPVPRQVDGHALGLVHDDAQLVQRLGDLDAVADHVLVEPVGVDGVRKMHRRLLIPAADEDERILHAEIRVVADAGDQEDVAGAVVGVEVGPVIEVAVRAAGPCDRLRDLVNGEFVHGAEHQASPPMRRRNRAPW